MSVNFKIPEEIKNAIKSIDNENRIKILEVLYNNGALSYTDLFNHLSMKKGSLNYHLDKLLEGGLLDNYPKDGLFDQYRSYYTISPFGHRFLSGIFSVFKIPTLAEKKVDIRKIRSKNIESKNYYVDLDKFYNRYFELENYYKFILEYMNNIDFKDLNKREKITNRELMLNEYK